ncbi:hypothetical protein GCM10022237_31490 [Nocardioides ginsengisoli]
MHLDQDVVQARRRVRHLLDDDVGGTGGGDDLDCAHASQARARDRSQVEAQGQKDVQLEEAPSSRADGGGTQAPAVRREWSATRSAYQLKERLGVRRCVS